MAGWEKKLTSAEFLVTTIGLRGNFYDPSPTSTDGETEFISAHQGCLAPKPLLFTLDHVPYPERNLPTTTGAFQCE